MVYTSDTHTIYIYIYTYMYSIIVLYVLPFQSKQSQTILPIYKVNVPPRHDGKGAPTPSTHHEREL